MIPDDIVERVRQSVDIVDVIGEYVQLKRAGTYYKGLSPFNKEKTPSFMVSPQRQSFKCYSSGHGGDVFKFIMLYERIDFPAAIRRLAQKARIDIPERSFGSSQDSQVRSLKEKLFSLHSHLSTYWRDLLLKSNEAEVQAAREYLKARKIPLDWIKDYSLGYAPTAWEDTVAWAKKAGFTTDSLLQGGVALESQNKRIYSRFRGRLMFPIANETGQIVAFSGRLLVEDSKSPKYMNSPETAIFKKSRILFGLDRAKRAILDADQVIVCEGQIDVLRCHSAGILNVVAPLGTAFTPEHCQSLKRLTSRVLLCLDGDRAGQATAERLGPMLVEANSNEPAYLQSELGLSVVQLPPTEDPDSYILKHGAEKFRDLLAQPTDYLDFYIQHLSSRYSDGVSGNKSAAAHRKMIEAVSELIARVPNEAVRQKLALQAASRLQVAASLLLDQMAQAAKKISKNKSDKSAEYALSNQENSAENRKEGSSSSEASRISQNGSNLSQNRELRFHPHIESLMKLILASPESISLIQRIYHPSWTVDLAGAELLDKLLESHAHDEWSNAANVYSILSEEEQNYVAGLDLSEFEVVSWTQEEIAKKMNALELFFINRTIERLGQENNSGDISQDRVLENTAQITQLLKRKTELTKK